MKPTIALVASLLGSAAGRAQATPVQAPVDTTLKPATTIGGVRVSADRDRKPVITKLTLPVSASVTATQARETVNILDTQDAVKYLPSVFVRKRNFGDTQSVLATRVWGPSSSARSLIFADGVPITALIANNNTIGGPRWGLVAPEEIERIDMMYGPFSAAYAGNSIGAVMEITTRTPEHREGSITQTGALQSFEQYGTSRNYATVQTSARLSDRVGKFSFVASGNFQNSNSQPLSYVTAAAFPTGTIGGFAAQNKLGATANVLGASGLLHTRMSNGTFKLGYNVAPSVRAAYTFGLWVNDADATVDPYLQRTGTPTFAGQPGFASGNYSLLQRHTSHSLSLRTDRKKNWDFEAIGTTYRFDIDRQRFASTTSVTDTTFGTAGRVASLTGTGWSTLDLKGAWHANGLLSARHTVTFGAHYDYYRLLNPTYTTSFWRSDAPQYAGIATEGDGKTQTQALWAQDNWRLSPSLRLTVGGRYEWWKGFDGINANGATRVVQPEVSAATFSPKAVLAWTPAAQWKLTGSIARAYRFATASELYQLVSTGTTFTAPDPNLKPDNVLASELRIERGFARSRVQIALFNDDIRDAIISQFKPLVAGSNTFYSFVSNVDHVRARGAELVLSARDMLIPGLELQGSATWLDAKILATSGRASATAPAEAAIGKQLPNIPKRRATFLATYRPRAALSVALGGRYSDKLYTTLDNADVNTNTWQGFSGWFVMDTHVSYRLSAHLTATGGVDNLLNRKYFLFHPFPQRTFVSSVKYGF
jgi:iron complex outermembrane recepter protein